MGKKQPGPNFGTVAWYKQTLALLKQKTSGTKAVLKARLDAYFGGAAVDLSVQPAFLSARDEKGDEPDGEDASDGAAGEVALSTASDKPLDGQLWVLDRGSVRDSQQGPIRTHLQEVIAMYGGTSGLLKKTWTCNKTGSNCAIYYVARHQASMGKTPSKAMQAHLQHPGNPI